MAILGGLLTRRALVLAKVETTPGMDALPVPSLDAILVNDPEFSIDPNILEREFVSPDLSPFEHVVGRKLASISFTTEVKSNGTAQSGSISDEPKLARLFRGCGYELVTMPGVDSFDSAADVDDTTEQITIVGHGFNTGDGPVQFAGGGTLPTGLVIDTDYWIIRVDDDNFQVAVSYANAFVPTAIDLTDGTGTNTVENVRNRRPVAIDSTNDTTAPTVLWTLGSELEAGRVKEGIDIAGPVLYKIEVTTGGASGVAQVTITNNNNTDGGADGSPETITTDVSLKLGTSGATVTAGWTGNLILGDIYYAMTFPDGIRAKPISTGFECLTIYLYEDGIRYRILASQGTFTVDNTAGNFGTLEFTFTGQYVAPDDVVLPTDEVFESTIPQQVELALLTWNSNKDLKAEQWTIDQANNVVPRPDVNKSDGFNGVRISDRTPAGGFNPEAELIATEDFWGDFAAGNAKVFTARVGNVVGNQVTIYAPKAQVSEIGFGDRDGIRSFEHSMLLKRFNGDDELEWAFG